MISRARTRVLTLANIVGHGMRGGDFEQDLSDMQAGPTPVWRRPHSLVSAFFNGSRLFQLAGADADLLRQGGSDSGVETDGLHAWMNSPMIEGDYIYGICSYGQLRCLRLSAGERVWETQAVTREKTRNASAFMVRNDDRYFINDDRGELIIARITPSGYSEISRAVLIRPTSTPGARRELGL